MANALINSYAVHDSGGNLYFEIICLIPVNAAGGLLIRIKTCEKPCEDIPSRRPSEDSSLLCYLEAKANGVNNTNP